MGGAAAAPRPRGAAPARRLPGRSHRLGRAERAPSADRDPQADLDCPARTADAPPEPEACGPGSLGGPEVVLRARPRPTGGRHPGRPATALAATDRARHRRGGHAGDPPRDPATPAEAGGPRPGAVGRPPRGIGTG